MSRLRPGSAEASAAEAVADAGYVVRILGQEGGFACARGDVLLRAALRSGIGFPHECSVGGCGTCRYELVEGEIDTAWPEAPGLSDRDRMRGRRLACQSRPRSDCVIKLRTMAQYQPVIRPLRTSAELVGRRALTHDMHEFRLRLDQDPGFLPGQYALLELPGVPGARAYSMSNTSAGDGRWEFVVRQVPGGSGSAALFEAVEIGARVGVDGPYGAAYLRADSPRDVVCIAGGSGLGPMLSIARGLAESGLRGRRLDFFYGCRRPADLAGEAELAALQSCGGGIDFHPCVSQPAQDDAWAGAVGMIHEHARQLAGVALASRDVYFAGPAPMVEAVLGMVVEAGVPAAQIHYDKYF